MHKFLRSIGFSDVRTLEELQKLIKKIVSEATETEVTVNTDEILYADYSLEFGENMGITVCGQFDALDEFHVDYVYPYMVASQVSSNERSIVERHAANVSYAGVCDDNKIGISIIYYLQNRIQYMKRSYNDPDCLKNVPVCLSGLSESGMIMMPLQKDEISKKKMSRGDKKRDKLIEAARQGNEEALETLTLDDIDMYSTISRKIKKSDVYTIVDTYFMPYGVETDQYSVLAEIASLKEVTNTVSGEAVYQMLLMCNGIPIDICINKKDLFGEPEVGRRFKGSVWLQGWLDWLS
ncbi:MAG: DUF3881 family protein [Lachnospiraceae bacterium]|nr:DUF3881 family protein [Lachnospiraceae bacterium]